MSEYNYDIKKKLVAENHSEVFKNWHEVAGITKEEFLEALKWVCDDPKDEKKRLTREIGLIVTPDAKIRYRVKYDPEGAKFYGYDENSYDEEKARGHIVKLVRTYSRFDIVTMYGLDDNHVFNGNISINALDKV